MRRLFAKRNASDIAVWFLFLLLVAAGLGALFSSDDETEKTRPGLVSLRSNTDLDHLDLLEEFSLRVALRGPLYLSIYRLEENGGAAERLFPPLSDPQDIPWPLTTADLEAPWVLPGKSKSFRFRKPGRGVIAVFANEDGIPLPEASILEAPAPQRRLQGRSDCKLLSYEVKAR